MYEKVGCWRCVEEAGNILAGQIPREDAIAVGKIYLCRKHYEVLLNRHERPITETDKDHEKMLWSHGDWTFCPYCGADLRKVARLREQVKASG